MPKDGDHRKENLSDEAQWVTAIRSGDAAGFEKLFKRYCRSLINFSRRIVGETEIAENIVQDVFLNLWQSRHRLDEQLSIKSYLYKSTMNQSRKHLLHLKVRTSAKDQIASGIEPADTPEDIHSSKETGEMIQLAISELPERCRLIFTMNRFDGLTYGQIAHALDISIKTVETQMGRALVLLRKRLHELI